MTFWDRVAAQYASTREVCPPQSFDWICSQVAPGQVCLDLGCGPRPLRIQGARAILALDASLEMLRAARPLLSVGEGATYLPLVAQAERLPIADGSVGAVAAIQAFHHFDARAALAEVSRVLQPDGRLVLGWTLLNTSDEVTLEYADLLDLLVNETSLSPRPMLDVAGFRLVAKARHPHASTYADEEAVLRRIATTSLVAGVPERVTRRLVGEWFRRSRRRFGRVTVHHTTVLRSYTRAS